MDPKRIVFVERCGELLHRAKPNLVSCKLSLGKDIQAKAHDPIFVPDSEYVIVTCENEYTYKICVEGNSLISIATAIFTSMEHK